MDLLRKKIPLFLVLVLLSSTRCAAEDFCGQTAAAVAEAAKLRRLEPKQPVSCRVAGREEFLRLATKLILEDTDQENLRVHGEVLYYQGLIPRDYDYARCVAKALASNAAAFYSWRLKQFVVPSWRPTPFPILVHEAVHALQDQHYEIARFASKKFIFDDQNIAQGSILEGDASILEQVSRVRHSNDNPTQYDELEGSPIEHECELPRPLLHLFDAMYEQGTDYVHTVGYKQKNLDQLFRNPVKTTKSVLANSITDNSELLSCEVPNSVVLGHIGVFGVSEFLRSQSRLPEPVKPVTDLADDCFAANSTGMYQAKYRFSNQEGARSFYNALMAFWKAKDSAVNVVLSAQTVSVDVRKDTR